MTYHCAKMDCSADAFSFGMVAFVVPETVFGLGTGPAEVLHEGSTLVVVLHALRLLAYR